MIDRGSSGAKIIYFSDGVTKIGNGNGRTGEQGAWLAVHASPSVPRVFSVDEPGDTYEMERLTSAPPWALDHAVVLQELIAALAADVWCRPPVVRPSWDSTVRRVAGLITTYDERGLTSKLVRAARSVRWDSLPLTLTHGDPTFDNVMFRPSTDELVIIDPVPACDSVPDVRAADLGKIMLSVMGWESIRYRSDDLRFRVSPQLLQLHVVDDNEWRAAVVLGVVCLIRTFRYVNDDQRRELVRAVDVALGLL